MPSRNSVNKPKDNILRNKRASSLGQKRASIRAKGNTLSTAHIQASPSSLAHALYKNQNKSKTPLTTQTLSAKRLLKIERNKKYVAARNNGKNKKKTLGGDVEMEIDDADVDAEEKVNKVTVVRNALWSLVEDVASGNNSFKVVPTGNGTTLGGPFF